jgi:malate dehydrogenase
VAFVAVIGSGPLGGALAQKLALRNRVPEIRLIDPHSGMAQGKALDILQSAPIESFSARLGAAQTLHSAAGAAAIVFADAGATGTEHVGEAALALVRQIAAMERTSPLVFAGANQQELIGRAVGELHLERTRVLGTASTALESALRALAGLSMDSSGVEVQLQIVGAPPARVAVGWEAASCHGQPLRSLVAPHVLSALTARIPSLWPPGPLALASAAARVVEAIVNGSRRQFSCFVSLDAGPSRNSVAAMPVVVGPRGVDRVLEPALTRLERTQMENAIEQAQEGGSSR